jgi:DNA-directed RNA polymerase specialized sigma24 family protein
VTDDDVAARLDAHRPHVTAVAHRVLGSRAGAEAAVLEAWRRLGPHDVGRADVGEADEPESRLTTEVARVCLEVLRARGTEPSEPGVAGAADHSADPGDGAVLSESLAEALVVVADTLSPAERVAFVLRDLYGTSYDEVARVLGRSETATRQLAGRARRRVQSPDRSLDAERTVQERVVEAFLAASRTGDLEEVAWLLHPGAVLRADPAEVAAGGAADVVGADAVAATFASRSRGVGSALLDGFAAAARSDDGLPQVVFGFTVVDGRIAELELLADPDVLARLDLVIAQGRPDSV